MPSVILVTGAFGFVGRHVARAAAKAGYTVHGIGHGSWTRAEWHEWGLSDWHHADITLDAMVSYGGDPDIIIHCAGSGVVGFSMSHPAQDFDRTVLTTRDVLEYMRLHQKHARLVLPSSAGVYGDVDTLPISVNAPLRPASPYGIHKKMAEDLCRSYSHHFNIASSIVRLFSIYGIGLRKQLLWDACKKLKQGSAAFGGSGEEIRDWVHVEDASRLLLLAGEAASPLSPVINGASGSGQPIRNVILGLATSFNGSSQISFSGVSRPGDPLHFVGDACEAHALGWHPNHKLEQELPVYAEWFKAGAF